MELVLHVMDDLEKSKVATTSALTKEGYELIKTYLRKNHPREVLKLET